MTWLPKSVVCLSYYDLPRFRSDAFAALILCLQLCPLALAIAIASGLHPFYGIYCAAIAGFLASVFGDSKIRVSAPNILFIAVASSIVAREGVLALSLTTLLAGLLLMFFGAIGLGAAIRVLPRPVVLGFSTGIAVLVISQELPDFLGINSQIPGAQAPSGGLRVLRHITQIEPHAIILAIAALVLIVACRKAFRYLPAGLIVMTTGALLVKLNHFPVRTIGAFCGSNLVPLHLHLAGPVRRDLLGSILAHAFAIAVLVGLESVRAVDLASSLTGEHSSPDGELLVHGGVNVASAFAGGLPASGAFSYTSENAHAGAQTPVAGILQSVFLVAFLLLIAPLVPFTPMPVISAIILANGSGMTNWRELPKLVKGRNLEFGAWLATSFLTVATDLPVAVAAGMLIALFLYVRKQR
jgi:SulP family sulfate permease